jgi:hypothetical protein
MKVIALHQDFRRACTARCAARRSGMPGGVVKASSIADEVDCAAREVLRALDATHSAIALRSAATAGDSDSRIVSQEVHDVICCVFTQAPPFHCFIAG